MQPKTSTPMEQRIQSTQILRNNKIARGINMETTKQKLDEVFGWKEYYIRTLYHNCDLSDIYQLLRIMGYYTHAVAVKNAKLKKTSDGKHYIEFTVLQSVGEGSNFERVLQDIQHINSGVEPILGLLLAGSPTQPEKIDRTQKVT